jgi:thymidylate kinase
LVILVEGPDSIGKDSQIQHIKKQIEHDLGAVHILHYSALSIKEPLDLVKEESFKLYKEMFDLLSFANINGINIILNRSHIGEAVYSPIYRNYDGSFIFPLELKYCYDNRLNTDQTKNIYSPNLNWYNTKLIVFTENAQTLIDRDIARGDNKSFSLNIENRKKELDLFEKAYNKSFLCKQLISITGLNEQQVWEQKVLPFLHTPNIHNKDINNEWKIIYEETLC